MNQWTSFCIVVSSKESFYRTFINGELVYEELNYEGSHRRDSSNLWLLNQRGGGEQTAGAVTDLQVWSRALAEEETRGWQGRTIEPIISLGQREGSYASHLMVVLAQRGIAPGGLG